MSDDAEQLELLQAAPADVTPVDVAGPSALIARVVVDTPLAHLDRPFDYVVPAELDEQARVGCRVKVRFAGRLSDGFVLDRVDATEHEGRLAPLAKVVSAEPVLSSEIAELAREVADRWAGTLPDVLRLAVPPRHARAEAAARPVSDGLADLPDAGPDTALDIGFLDALSAGREARAVRTVLPSESPAHLVASAVLACLRAGRGAVVCVPDAADLDRWDAVFAEVLGPDRYVRLSADQGPAARYRAFLAARRGDVQVVLGTRAAAWAPVRDLGLVAMWDDGDDLYAEPRAPYAHTREVLLMRAARIGAGVLLAAHARSVEAQSLVESGWCRDISPDAVARRAGRVRLSVTDGRVHGSIPARLPSEVFSAVRSSSGAVLVQVPRRGYRGSLSCATCRTPARCTSCGGSLGQAFAEAPLSCRWCGQTVPDWACAHCGGRQVRSTVVGQVRTAEEYARAFPDHEVVTSGGQRVLSRIEPGRRIILSTPGAEPHVAGGYGLVVLMDTWLALARDDVRVVEEAHRRWFNALALVGPDGHAIAVGDSTALQSLVRGDPVGLAVAELADRRATHLPPTARLATIESDADVIGSFAGLTWTPHTEVLGPVPVDARDPQSQQRLVLRTPRSEAADLSRALRSLSAERSAAKLPPVRIRVDPLTF